MFLWTSEDFSEVGVEKNRIFFLWTTYFSSNNDCLKLFKKFTLKISKTAQSKNLLKKYVWLILYHRNWFPYVLKVARVVKLKLAFMEWFFYNLVIIIKLYKIWHLNLDKALLFPRNQATCLKNWKLWRPATTTKFNIFCWNFAYISYLTMSTKECSWFFWFCLDLELLIKTQNTRVCRNQIFLIFANNSRSKQKLEKSRTPFCRHW